VNCIRNGSGCDKIASAFKTLSRSLTHILIRIDGEPCPSNPALLFAVISRSKILEAHVTHVQLYAHLALEFWAGEPDFGTCAKN
jgi:hypothetical protein